MDTLVIGLAILVVVLIVVAVIRWLFPPGPSPLEKERESGKALRQQGSTEAVTRYLQLVTGRDIQVTPASILVMLDATPIKNEALFRAQQGLVASYRYYRRRDVPSYIQPSRRTVDLRYRELLKTTSEQISYTIRLHRDFPQNVLVVSIYDDGDCIYSVRCKLDNNGGPITAPEPGLYPPISLPKVSLEGLPADELKRLKRLKDLLQHEDKGSQMEVRENKPSVYEKRPVVSFHEPLPITMKYIRSLSPHQFEGLVRDLLVSLGYHARLTSASADGGVDIVATGAEKRVLIQCKQYEKPVEVKHLRELYGAVADEDAEAWFVTSSTFTEPAMRFAKDKGIRTINGQELLRLIATASPSARCLERRDFERVTCQAAKSQKLTTSAAKRLEKILALEESTGYANRAVIGGLESLATFWSQEAQREGLSVTEIMELLRRYPEAGVERRKALIEEIRLLLQGENERGRRYGNTGSSLGSPSTRML